MIQYLKNEQIDKAKWDACIEASPEGLLYALSWYLDVVAPGWQALVEVEEGQYVTVMPLPGTKKLGFAHLSQTFFAQQLGIFSVKPDGVRAVADQFLAQTVSRFRFIHNYKFCTENTAVLKPLKDKYGLQPRYTRYLSLQEPYEQLYSNYTRDRKKNLKIAEKSNLTLVNSDDVEPLIQLYKAHISPKMVGGFTELIYQLLRDVFVQANKRGMAQLVYSLQNDEINTGCLFLKYKDRISCLISAANSAGRKTNGKTLIRDRIIRQCAGTNYTMDFESPAIESIDSFNATFGAEQIKYSALYQNNLPWFVKTARNARMRLYKALASAKDSPV
ncbi:GNAT family N-acetyltransferase [Pontibacter harenae]|uniref:GNAT family N-acetyltransferase n=1 Tax=Pontibacter harenae TaxID=2894083 RepID=UPI001E356C4A|nr:GNAT family N-acetyltransferase [Pontibacter harenae]MCC9168946.1 GNAT family N-acetyltransferase [Pontibacter harenae]